LKLIPNLVPVPTIVYTLLTLVKSGDIKIGSLLIISHVPIYFNNVDGKYCNATLPPESNGVYPLLIPFSDNN